MSEAQEQCKLIKWADKCVQMKIHPELSMLYAVPNGGRRDKAEAAHLKRQGVRAGVPDLCLAVPKGKYHGLYIELKVGNNKTSEHQDKLVAESFTVRIRRKGMLWQYISKADN